jgi:hypothetical protein
VKRPRHTWSLGHELATIELAARAISEVLSQVADTHGDERRARELAAQAAALATLLHLRLRDLGRLLRGELAPWILAGPHNVVLLDTSRTNPGEDVVFSPAGDDRNPRATRPPSR